MADLKIHEDYLALMPRLSREQYDALEADILANGCLEPIKVNKDGVILDGHTRYEICRKHAISFETDVMEFASPEDEMDYVTRANAQRRQMNDYQLVEAELLRVQKMHSLTETAEGLAKDCGVSERIFWMAKKIYDKAKPEEKERVRSGKESITSVYNRVFPTTVKHKSKEQEPEPVQSKLGDDSSQVSMTIGKDLYALLDTLRSLLDREKYKVLNEIDKPSVDATLRKIVAYVNEVLEVN